MTYPPDLQRLTTRIDQLNTDLDATEGPRRDTNYML